MKKHGKQIIVAAAWLALLVTLPAVGRGTEVSAVQLQQGAASGLMLKDGRLVLYRLRERFDAWPKDEYRLSLNITCGEDEYGVVDYNTDAAYVSQQTRPAQSIFVETHDNDSVSIRRSVTPTIKGFLMLDLWPTRLWPTSGTLALTLSESGERSIRFPLSASDYTHPMVKQVDGETLSAKGGTPYFSSYMKHNIYVPSEAIPESEQRWWTMRLLFRPAYVAGSLDGSVCREIEDPEKRPIAVRNFEIGIQQLETHIRDVRFKALLGEAVGPVLELKENKWGEVDWRGTAPEKTRIGLQVRVADDRAALEKAEWRGPSAAKAYFLEKGRVPVELAAGKYLQFKVLLKALIDAPFDTSPEIEAVVITQEG